LFREDTDDVGGNFVVDYVVFAYIVNIFLG